MAAANESQGLKIAVAVFVALTVILAVTTYFGYSQYAQADAQKKDADSKLADAARKLDTARQELGELKQLSGYGNVEEFTQLKDAVKKNEAKLNERLTALKGQVDAMIQAYRQAGGNDQKVAELSNTVDQIIAQYQGEPNRTFQSALDRMMELMSNMAVLSAQMTLDNEGLRRDLAQANEINEAAKEKLVQASEKSNTDLVDVQGKSETDRRDLLAKVDNLQTLNTQQATRIAALETESTRLRTQLEARINELQKQLRYYRELSEKSEVTLDTPSGKVTYVDYNRHEVRVNLKRSDGAREQMVFSIFDQNAPGVPNERPKAVIELIRVGQNDSVARIDMEKTTKLAGRIDPRTNRQIGPIRPGDLVYSPAFSPNDKKRFALIGMMDVDRDGRDDRDDLKRLIRNAGGEIAYDLPPPVNGKESGSLDGPISFYVIDERNPIKPPPGSVSASGADEAAFESRKAEARQALRDAGVRPMPIERLLAYIGYTPGIQPPVNGQVESINRSAVENLLNPKGRPTNAQPPAGNDSATTPPGNDKPADGQPGDAMPDDNDPK